MSEQNSNEGNGNDGTKRIYLWTEPKSKTTSIIQDRQSSTHKKKRNNIKINIIREKKNNKTAEKQYSAEKHTT